MSNISRYLYLSRRTILTTEEKKEWENLEKWVDNLGLEEYNRVRKEYVSRINKYKRIKKFIIEHYSFTNKNYFITLTINDNYINLSRQTYLKQIRNLFHDKLAICNTDYGELNNRLHFHLVLLDCDNTQFLDGWKYGFFSCIPIRKFEDSSQLARYCSKLCNHALKVNSHIIYYRKL